MSNTITLGNNEFEIRCFWEDLFQFALTKQIFHRSKLIEKGCVNMLVPNSKHGFLPLECILVDTPHGRVRIFPSTDLYKRARIGDTLFIKYKISRRYHKNKGLRAKIA